MSALLQSIVNKVTGGGGEDTAATSPETTNTSSTTTPGDSTPAPPPASNAATETPVSAAPVPTTNTTSPSTTPAATNPAPAVRYVPGADSLTTSKPKNRKKKSKSSVTPGGLPTLSSITTKDSTAAALMDHVPGEKELPSGLMGDKSELEKELKLDQEKESKGERVKGPAEELVAKRIRLLNKKVQRINTYKDKPHSDLNPDQQAARDTLPMLQAGVRELEDVLKGLENIDRDESHKREEQSRTHSTALSSARSEAVSSYKTNTLPILTSIIRLHTLLHPPSKSSSFMTPDLPNELQDVSREDVRFVDEVYERLGKGGEGVVDEVVREVEGKQGSSIYHFITGEAKPSTSDNTTASTHADIHSSAPAASFSTDHEAFSIPSITTTQTIHTKEITDSHINHPTTIEPTIGINEYKPHHTHTKFDNTNEGPEDSEPKVEELTEKAMENATFEEKKLQPVAADNTIINTTTTATGNQPMSFIQSSELEEINAGQAKPSVSDEQEVTLPETSSTSTPAAALDWTADDDDHVDINALREQFGMARENAPAAIATAAATNSLDLAPPLAPSQAVTDPATTMNRPNGLPPVPQNAHRGGLGGSGGGRVRNSGPSAQSSDWRRGSGGPQGQQGQGREENGNVGFNGQSRGSFRGGPGGHHHHHHHSQHQQQQGGAGPNSTASGAQNDDDGFQVQRRRGGQQEGNGSGFKSRGPGGPGGPGHKGSFRGARGGRGGQQGSGFQGPSRPTGNGSSLAAPIAAPAAAPSA